MKSSNKEINSIYRNLSVANKSLQNQVNTLEQSVANIQALLNNTLQAFILLDKNARVVTYNELAAKTIKNIFGTKISVRTKFQDILTNNAIQKLSPDLKNSFLGKTVRAEHDLTDPKGQEHSFIFSFTPVLDKGRKVESISFSMLDVTEQKKTKAELARSEKLIDSVFHTADIGLAVVNETGKFVKVNDGFSKLLGYKKEELSGKTYLKIIGKGHRKKNGKTQDYFSTGDIVNRAHRVVNKSGNILDVFITNSVFYNPNGNKYLVVTMRDITEERKFKDLMASAEKAMRIGSFEYNLFTRKLDWTDEMYVLYEVSKDFTPSFKSLIKFVYKEDRPKTDAAYSKLIQEMREVSFDFRLITNEGKEKWVNAHIIPILIKKQLVGFRGTLQDINDRKKAEIEIERLSWVARHTNNCVIITDKRGKVEWVNESFERITGYTLKDIIGRIPGEKLQGVDTDIETLKRVASQLKNQQPVNEVLLNYTKDRKPLWVNMDIAPIFINDELQYWIGILTDLTELVKAKEIQKNQESLEQRQRILNAIAGNFPEGIIGVLNKSMKYVFVGGSELKRLGHDVGDWISHELFDKISPQANAYALPFMKKVFKGETAQFDVDVLNNTYSVSAVPIQLEDKHSTRALVVIQNITERKKAEEESFRALMKQKELNELKSKFVTIASHEFRTPLGTIHSSADLVEQYHSRGDDANTKKHVARIKSSVNNLTGILNEFLSLSRIEEGAISNIPTPFNLIEFCKSLVEEMRSIKRPGQQIIYKQHGNIDTVFLDRQHAKNILINLLSNAVKYSAQDKPIYFTSAVESGAVKFIIKDEGIGIAEEEKPRLFDAFFRAHNAAHIQGTGLGLHIVKRYLNLMKGTISFESELNKGSTFTIIIPQSDISK